MGNCTYLAFCVSPLGETLLQTKLGTWSSKLNELDARDLRELIQNPIRAVHRDGWVLRFWPAEKWFPEDIKHADLIEEFVDDHPAQTLLVKHGEGQDYSYDASGEAKDNPFDISVVYPTGGKDPYFSYRDEHNQRKNTEGLLFEQLERLQQDEYSEHEHNQVTHNQA